MKKIKIPDIGDIIYWEDFVKLIPGEENNHTYDQSNTKMPGYHSRSIGLYKHEKDFYLAVAVSNNSAKTLPAKIAKGMINNRFRTILPKDRNIDPSDIGTTMVPLSYLSLLYKDPCTYSNLFGPIDATMLDMALRLIDV